MGFLSSVGGAISSACSSIGGAISGACSAVGSFFGSVASGLSTVLDSVASFASSVGVGGLLTVLSIAFPVLGRVIAAVEVVLHVLGLLEPKEQLEEFGDRVLQAESAGIIPHDFSTYKEYVAKIRDFELDPEKSKQYNAGDKVIAAMSVQYWGMNERFGIGSGELLTHVVSDIVKNKDSVEDTYFTEARIKNILEKVESLADVANYFSGKLDAEDRQAVEKQLVNAEQELNPERSELEITRELEAKNNE